MSRASLKGQIEQAKAEIRLQESILKKLKNALNDLGDSRIECVHEWDSGLEGWEHEGCYCIHCGINDQYAPNHEKMVLARRKAISDGIIEDLK